MEGTMERHSRSAPESEYRAERVGQNAAFDNRDKCEQKRQHQRLLGPNTLRCLDRRTGRVVHALMQDN